MQNRFFLFMNPMDLSFDQKVELVTKSNRIPYGNGVKFIEFIEPNINQIIQQTGNKITNKARTVGTYQEIIAAFKDHIESGRYLFTYQQPVVCKIPETDSYELLCGEHRLQAHKGAKRDRFFCALVEFDNLEDKIIFQSNENDEDDEYVKALRTETDVIGTLSQLVEAEIIDINDDKSINVRLTRLNQKTSDFPQIREQLRAKHGLITPVRSYDDISRRKWCEEYKPEVQFSSRSNIVPINGNVYISKTFKGGSGTGGVKDLDYDPRCFFDDCFLLQNEKVTKVINVSSINGATSEKLPKIRQYKREKMMQEWLNRCLTIADDYRAGKYNPIKDVQFVFTPQVDVIDNMEEWV